MSKRSMTPRAVSRQVEDITARTRAGQMSGLHGMVRFNNSHSKHSRFAVGDLVKPKDKRRWPRPKGRRIEAVEPRTKEAQHVTYIEPSDDTFLLSFNNERPVFDERTFEPAIAEVIPFKELRAKKGGAR